VDERLTNEFMNLVQATKDSDWVIASDMLKAVAMKLKSSGSELWTTNQVSTERLKIDYSLSQLFFLESESTLIGVVFLMDSDPFFWPEAENNSSLFIHKLAVLPEHCGKGYGGEALNLIRGHASDRSLPWVRLDCDDREPLHKFYSRHGFCLVDIKRMETYMVARYQLQSNL